MVITDCNMGNNLPLCGTTTNDLKIINLGQRAEGLQQLTTTKGVSRPVSLGGTETGMETGTEDPRNIKYRKVSETKRWTFSDDELAATYQCSLLDLCIQNNPSPKTQPLIALIISQLKQKICGYRRQDVEKKLYDPDQFIDLPYTLHVLQLAVNHEQQCIHCFYCQNPVLMVYRNVRDPHQWTMERMDNSIGHNKGNVAIACLHCNVRRRTMYYERYLMTKQMVIVKKGI